MHRGQEFINPNLWTVWIIPILLILIIIISVYKIRKNKMVSSSALKILRQRYEKGEIDKAEYKRKKKLLNNFD